MARNLMKNRPAYKFLRLTGLLLLAQLFVPLYAGHVGYAKDDLPLQTQVGTTPEITQDQINSRINAIPLEENKADPLINNSDRSTPDLAYGAYQRGHYLTAFEHALPRAKLGDPAAQTLIAELYQKGLGIKRDREAATYWYKFASQNGSREAQFSYALKLLEGKYVAKDKNKARDLLKLAADAGHSVAQFNFAQIVADERPTSRGFEIALGYYAKAADQGLADAYFAMAQIFARGFGAQAADDIRAREYLVKAARNGIGNAQIELGIWLANGRGGKKDNKGALAWFKIAANGGNVIAQNRLARMLALGLGGEVKLKEAAKWYVLARRSGHKDAMLDDFFSSLEPGIRKQALEAANRWPSG